MRTFDRLDPWEMLGLARGASAEEIRSAYERLSARLAPGSLALYSIADPEEQDALQRALRAAYLQLLDEVGAIAHPGRAEHAAQEPTAAGVEPGGSSPAPAEAAGAPILLAGADAPDGELLRRAREARGISLDAMSQRTRIRRALLEALEAERFAELPERVFVRGFVFAVARVVGLDAEEVWAGYRARLETWSAARG